MISLSSNLLNPCKVESCENKGVCEIECSAAMDAFGGDHTPEKYFLCSAHFRTESRCKVCDWAFKVSLISIAKDKSKTLRRHKIASIQSPTLPVGRSAGAVQVMFADEPRKICGIKMRYVCIGGLCLVAVAVVIVVIVAK